MAPQPHNGTDGREKGLSPPRGSVAPCRPRWPSLVALEEDQLQQRG